VPRGTPRMSLTSAGKHQEWLLSMHSREGLWQAEHDLPPTFKTV
jgi:hypothetical protein